MLGTGEIILADFDVNAKFGEEDTANPDNNKKG